MDADMMELWIQLGVAVLVLVGMWKMFAKAGEPGWGALIPIYNLYLWIKLAGKPGWWVLLMLLPIANVIVWVLASIEISKRFGRGTGTALGLIFLPGLFTLILGLGSAEYTS